MASFLGILTGNMAAVGRGREDAVEEGTKHWKSLFDTHYKIGLENCDVYGKKEVEDNKGE